MAWTDKQLEDAIHNFSEQDKETQKKLSDAIASFCTYEEYLSQVEKRNNALENTVKGQTLLSQMEQKFPQTLSSDKVNSSKEDLKEYGIVITAGGEGERLMLSLMEQGTSEEELKDFTKATWPLPEFPGNNGALQINLSLLSKISAEINHDIPVIVTTGPEGTTTARVIPKIIQESNSFGLKNLKVIAQNERLHLTEDNKVAWKLEDGEITLATNPDETGGPLMKLLEPENGETPLEWLENHGASKVMVLQGTAVYNPLLVEQIASAGKKFDGMGIGISRSAFPESDPYGTFILASHDSTESLRIIEKSVRNSVTESLQDESGKYLPFNTGFYSFTTELLKNNPLPDYASPVKSIFPGYENAEKVGYAATDVIAPAEKSGVLTIPETDFAVIKTSDDLPVLTKAALHFSLDSYC